MSKKHPRTLIRHAVVALLKKSPVGETLQGRIYANRTAHWLEEELPACGVYILDEDKLESKSSPAPDERKLSLVVEVLVRDNVNLDDTLDALSVGIEQALHLDPIGQEMLALGGTDTLLTLEYTGMATGQASDGSKDFGVMVISYDLEFSMPAILPDLPDFETANTGWHLNQDEVPEAVDNIEFKEKA